MSRARRRSIADHRRQSLERLHAQRASSNESKVDQGSQQNPVHACQVTAQQLADIERFRKATMQMPSATCVCCDWSLYPEDCVTVSADDERLFSILQLVERAISDGKSEAAESALPRSRRRAQLDAPKVTLCKPCEKRLRKGQLPATCLLNGLQLGPVPPEVERLTNFELSLLAPVRPFQTIHMLPKGQKASQGVSLLMPVDLQKQLKSLPRPRDSNDIIIVQLPSKQVIRG